MKTSVLLLVLVALAASLHLASAQSSSTYNSTCNNFCTASGNNSIYLNCTMQCVNCISKAPSGCIPFFNPVFTGGMLQNCECGFSLPRVARLVAVDASRLCDLLCVCDGGRLHHVRHQGS
ncbi:hypothetical protein CLOP_g1819 [Closterium sp. NIES-67]|nr:hypothetical protein CLOP_g1819 [Closterium sp. NIES-67]